MRQPFSATTQYRSLREKDDVRGQLPVLISLIVILLPRCLSLVRTTLIETPSDLPTVIRYYGNYEYVFLFVCRLCPKLLTHTVILVQDQYATYS
jgi:hypothetical protein